MKINKKLTAIAIYFALAYPQTIHTFFNDDFEEEFITKMHAIEKNIQTSFNQFHTKFFHDLNAYNQDLDARSKIMPNQSTQPMIQQNPTSSQNNVNFYQQSTSSLSFSNVDKAIKITEQKNSTTTIYTIHVTDKKASADTAQESMPEMDNLAELKALQTYITKAFHAKQAVAILQECINAMSHEQKNKLVNIESSTDGNQKKYTIEISQKKDAVDTDEQAPEIKTSHKNKKQNSYAPRNKAIKKS